MAQMTLHDPAGEMSVQPATDPAHLAHLVFTTPTASATIMLTERSAVDLILMLTTALQAAKGQPMAAGEGE